MSGNQFCVGQYRIIMITKVLSQMSLVIDIPMRQPCPREIGFPMRLNGGKV